MRNANKQIGSTKRLLKLPDAIGVVVIIFDLIPGIIPQVVTERVRRCFALPTSNGEQAFDHIDIAMSCLRLKDFRFNGNTELDIRQCRTEDTDHVSYARSLLEVLSAGTRKSKPRLRVRSDDWTQQLRANIFDG